MVIVPIAEPKRPPPLFSPAVTITNQAINPPREQVENDTVTVRSAVADIWDRLYLDEDSKDVRITTRDGVVRAHGLVLAQISDVLKAMLNSTMSEAVSKQIDMREVTSCQLIFTLRLAYTGRINSADWAGMEDEPARESDAWDHVFRAEAPVEVQFGRSMPTTPPFYVDSPYGVTKGRGKGTGKGKTNDAGNRIPLDLLFGCAAIAKKYSIPGFLPMMLHKIKQRLTIHNFNKVMSFAVSIDLSPLKLFCIRFAEEQPEVRRMFQQSELNPEVEFELLALWSRPGSGTQDSQSSDGSSGRGAETSTFL